jgi:hypothetical protein
MKTSLRHLTHRLVIAGATLLAAFGAHATMGSTTLNYGGGISSDPGLTYGPTGGGNVFELIPYLAIEGMGVPKSPTDLVKLNSLLSFSATVSGEGTDLVTLTYTITNKGTQASDAFNKLRLWVYANPDGDQVNYLDQLGETWGAQGAKDPVAREGGEFDSGPDSILGRSPANFGLTDTPITGVCTTAAGCDGVFALQWNAATLGPGESFVLRMGLSDSGKSLSSRYLTATSIADPSTLLTFSGSSEVTPAVPEPSQLLLLLAGLGVMGLMASRRH